MTSVTDVVILAPESLAWVDESNVKVGTTLSNVHINTENIQPNSGFTATSGRMSWNRGFSDGLVHSCPRLRSELLFTFSGITTSGGPAFTTPALLQKALQDNIGTTAFPLNRMIGEYKITLNGQTFNGNLKTELDDILASMSPEDLALLSPCSVINQSVLFSKDANNNALRCGLNAADSSKTRGVGANYYYEIDVPAVDTFTFKLVIEETLLLRPFQFHKIRSPQPFPNLKTFQMTLDIGSSNDVVLAILNSGDGLNNIAPGAAVGAVGGCTLTSAEHYLVVQTKEPSMLAPVPRVLFYNSPRIEEKQKADVVFAAAGIAGMRTAVVGSFAMSGVPSVFEIGVRRVAEPAHLQDPARYAVIKSVSITADGVPNMLQGVSQDTLYAMSASNGLNYRKSSWLGLPASPAPAAVGNYGIGGPLFIKPSDLPMAATTMPNVDKMLTMTCRVECYLPAGAPLTLYELYVKSVEDEYLVYNADNSTKSYDVYKPVISAEQVARAGAEGKISFTKADMSMNRVLGGSWFGDLFSKVRKWVLSENAKKLSRGLRNLPLVSGYVGDSTIPGRAAQLVGYGNTSGGDVTVLGGKKRTARKATGGRKLTAAELSDVLHRG